MKKLKILLSFLLLVVAFLTGSRPVFADTPVIGSAQIYQEIDGQKCGFMTGCSVAGQDVTIEVTNVTYSNGTPVPANALVEVRLIEVGAESGIDGCQSTLPSPVQKNGNTISVTIDGGYIETNCSYALEVIVPNDGENTGGTFVSKYSPKAQASCAADQCSEDTGLISTTLYKLCDQLKTGTPQHNACMACFTSKGIWTAVGCVPSNPERIITMIVSVGLAVGGGIVLIMILVGSFMLSVSQGDPNKTKEAKEKITSAVIGLLFVIFSVTILQFIGVSILRIPGFGE